MAFQGFPLLAFYVPLSLSLSLLSILSVSLLVLRWTFHPQPASPCVCALNSSNCSFEGQSHKTSFYAGPVSLMGLSLCTMLRSKPQKLQTGMATPRRRTDRQTPWMTGRLSDLVPLHIVLLILQGGSQGIKIAAKDIQALERCWQSNILLTFRLETLLYVRCHCSNDGLFTRTSICLLVQGKVKETDFWDSTARFLT